jgi:CPA2 family monovalent cation:H+ antiporter-2
MHSAHEFLTTLALVLGTAAVTTVLFQRLRQPVVLGYILAGLLIGPHVAFPLFADPGTIQTLSEIGVILLMFALGLEFRLGKLITLGPTAGLTAVIQCSIMVWLGFVLGRAFGWTSLESIFTGALLAISSTTIIAKAFDEQGIGGKLRELVVGILIIEDLIAVLLMATLTAIATGSGLSIEALALTTGRLLLFLVALIGIGLLVVPRAVRAITKLGRPETTLVASVGFCFAVALLASSLGYSVALGAFIAGSLVAESGEEKEIEHLVGPVKDIFAAIFFVSVGMLIDPALVREHATAIAVLTLLVIAGKIAGVSIGAFLTGNSTRLSIQAGMSLAQIGEFSFIIAGLGLALGATGSFLYPVAVAVSAITTLTTPWLIRASGPFANFVDRKLPKRLQTFVALYGSWIERVREAPRRETEGAAVRRGIAFLLVDMSILIAVIIGTSFAREPAVDAITARSGGSRDVATIVVIAAAVLLALPFLVGIARLAQRLGARLAQLAFPGAAEGRVDTAAAPRRALLVSLELAIVLLVGLPILAITQPFIGGYAAPVFALGIVVMLGVALWRTATNLEGHVRAGAQMVLEVLAAQSHAQRPAQPGALEQVDQLLPGLGAPESLHLDAASPAAGKTLSEVNLRGLTGATVLAIQRGDTGHSFPSGHEVLQAGDVLALAGTEESIEAARALLAPPSAAP